MSSPYLFFLKCFVFPFTKTDEKSIAIHELLNKKSLRCEYHKKNQWLSPIRNFVSSTKMLFATNNDKTENSVEKIAWSYFSKNSIKISEYLEYNNQKSIKIVSQEQLKNCSSTIKTSINLLQLFLVFLIIQATIFFRKNKEQYALIITVLTELLLLENKLNKHQTTTLFIFNAFEFNTYFSNLYLNKKGINVSLIPSSNPISIYYKKVYCNTFIFTAPFQKIEYEKLKSDWKVQNYKNWKPFGSDNIPFNSSNGNTPKNTIGFLSSAMKLRDTLGHTNLSDNKDLKAELKLISVLKKLIENKSNFELIVFLHPLEKNSKKNLSISTEYYKSVFGEKIKFAPVDKSSKQNFNLVDIGISSFSSSQIERLYGGYKVIFSPFDFLENYYGDDRLNKISAKTEDDLFEKIEKISLLSAEEYFTKYNLQEYRWDSYE